jgi:hypothetical protein
MAHNRFVSILTVPVCIGVGEAIKVLNDHSTTKPLQCRNGLVVEQSFSKSVVPSVGCLKALINRQKVVLDD